MDGLLVHRNQFVMAFRQGLAECLDDTVDADDGADLQQSAQDNHVEGLCHAAFVGFVHGIDAEYADVLTGRRSCDAIAVVDEDSPRFYLAFELVQ